MNSDLLGKARQPSAPPPPPSFAAYDSGWVRASNNRNMNLEFDHLLGVLPTQLMIFFSPDKQMSYAIHAVGQHVHGINPVSMWTDTQTLTLSIRYGDPLYRQWDGNRELWSHWSEGYFRVIANP